MKKQIAVYGCGGSGKTELLYTLAKHLWQTKKQKTLVFTSDPGGSGCLDPGVQAGAIELIRTDNFPNPIDKMNLIVSGLRPETISDPMSKWKPVDFKAENIGALCIEGATSWSSTILSWCVDKHASGQQIGQQGGGEGSKTMTFADGDFKMGIATQVHFGIAQQYLYKFICKATSLWARSLDLIVWTALEQKAELKKEASQSEETKPLAYGPKFAGSALTGQCIPWFTDVLHLDIVNPKKDPTTGTILGERKLFLTQHYAQGDPVPYLAKNSVNSEGKMPPVIAPNLGTFLMEVDKANQRALSSW